MPPWIDRFPNPLYPSLRVCESAFDFRKSRRRQDNVRQSSGVVHEYVLDHDKFGRIKSASAMARTGIRHNRVLAHDEHGLHLTFDHLVHGRDLGNASALRKRRAPRLLELLPDLRLLKLLVAR